MLQQFQCHQSVDPSSICASGHAESYEPTDFAFARDFTGGFQLEWNVSP